MDGIIRTMGDGLGFGGRGVTPVTGAARTECVILQQPLQRVLMLCRRSIDDVVNSRVVKNEVIGYWKVYHHIQRRAEILDLERQWNHAEL